MVVDAEVPISLAQRIRGEFLEMPGLCLTLPQARRLWALDDRTCRQALATLLREGFLQVTPAGVYLRTGRTRGQAA